MLHGGKLNAVQCNKNYANLHDDKVDTKEVFLKHIKVNHIICMSFTTQYEIVKIIPFGNP